MTYSHHFKCGSNLAKCFALVASLMLTTTAQGADSKQSETRELIIKATPTYPVKAVKKKLSGYVVMTYEIDKYGSPTNISVKKSEPEGVFDKNAIKALEQWQYSTTKEQSDKRYEVRLDFKLTP